jgi:nucleotide-binding universal stress UspA family protein
VLRSILVALDGSAYSEPVTAFALDWAVRYGARLVGVGVLDEHSIQVLRASPRPLVIVPRELPGVTAARRS